MRSVARTDEVLGQLQLVLSTATDGETAERGYVITGDESYLEPYQHAVRSIDAVYQRLRRLTADNADRQTRFDGLEPLIRERLDLFSPGHRAAPRRRLRQRSAGDSHRSKQSDSR